jgi:hypothetical protein
LAYGGRACFSIAAVDERRTAAEIDVTLTNPTGKEYP